MKFSKSIASLAFVSLASAHLCVSAADTKTPAPAPTAAAADVRALLPDPAHRAIFCGAEGTETSAAYSQALAMAIRTQLARGSATSVEKAFDQLHAALCGSAKR